MMIDATGMYAVQEVVEGLRARGTPFVAASRLTGWHLWSEQREFDLDAMQVRTFPTTESAVR